jgi:plasmid stabilization system protein ParE
MAFAVEVSERASAEIDLIYQELAERSPAFAERWYGGLMRTLESLRDHPRRCTRVHELSHHGEVRRALYGKGRNQYRVIFSIEGATVRILRLRHAARRPVRN